MADPCRPRDSLRPELRDAIDESWKLHEAAYRYLGRGATNEAWGKTAISDIGNDVTPCRDKDTKPGEHGPY